MIQENKTVRRLTPLDFDNYLKEVDINGATEGVKALLVLRKNYGTQKVCEWCTAIMERIQQAKVLQQRVYEKSISAKTTQRDKLDDSSLPCPEYIAEWLLRDMWEQQECRCSSQGWESSEQFARELNESVQELSRKNTPSKKEMCGMWKTSKRTRILRETFAEIQKIWESVNVKSWREIKTVRRLTPLEAERLMGLPDYWTDVEINGKPAPDSKRYKAIGNGMAVPCSDFILKRIVEVADNGKS
jgi:site-specific DNA-cytosine methylase